MSTRPSFTEVVTSRGALALATLLAVAGCMTVGRDYEPPKAEVAAEWHEDGAGLARREAELGAWWRQLDDPILDELVDRAVVQGLAPREAWARLREARALRGASASELYPSLDAALAYQRRNESKNTPFGGFVPDYDFYSAGFDASWELDLWGRVRRSVEAADADLAASVEDVRDVQITVAAETALRYVDLRSFQRRLEIARNNVALQEQTLELVRSRLDAGLVGERDVAQARTNVEATRSQVPLFETGLRAAENRLAVLLGMTPGALAAELGESRPIPVPPAEVAVGVPVDLLRRRADVRRAERQLAAETARIGVAEGELYPRLMLTGTLGVEADDAGDLFDSASKVLHIGPSLRWNIFDAGRRRSIVEAQDARAEQALVRWEGSVLAALEETENAMTAFVREQTRHASLLEAATQARLSVDLAETEYREGLSDFQPVIDSQRAAAVLEDNLAESDGAMTTHLIALYKSLGGGWDQPIELAQADAP